MIAGMRSLWSDLSESSDLPGDESGDMLENLDLFVSDELDGVDVRLRHPSVWRHLQVCAVCREVHDELLDLMVAMGQSDLLELPPFKVTAQPAPAARPGSALRAARRAARMTASGYPQAAAVLPWDGAAPTQQFTLLSSAI